MGARRAKRRDRAGGQSLVEFALVAPIFFLLVFSVIQLGLVMAAQNGLVDGVRGAARRAATYRINEQSIQDTALMTSICSTIDQELRTRLGTRIIGYSGSAADPRLIRTIAYEWQTNPGGSDSFVVAHISASYRNPLYVPLVSAFLDRADGTTDNQLTLSASEQMRIENPALTPSSSVTYTC